MNKSWVVILLGVCACAAQGPIALSELQSQLQADLHGQVQQEMYPRQPIRWPEISTPERPTGQSVSVATLQHKVPKEARRCFERAKKLSKSGDHKGAAAALETAVTVDPKFAAGHNALGAEYAQVGRFDEAKTALRRALELDPNFSNAYYNLAAILLVFGDLAGAEENSRKLLQNASENPYAHWLLGCVLWQKEVTRAEGLQHLQYAARSLKPAREFLKELGAR